MQLSCEGCEAVVEGETAAVRHAAMMAHEDAAHSNDFDGKVAAEIRAMRHMMDEHVHHMIVDQAVAGQT